MVLTPPSIKVRLSVKTSAGILTIERIGTHIGFDPKACEYKPTALSE